MKLFMDSFWRAFAYCLHPKVIMLSLLPLILMAVIVTGLGAMYWEEAVNTVRTGLEDSAALGWAWTWLERVGLMNLKAVLAPLVIILVVTPVVMIMSLLAVSFMMTPALVNLVGSRRFPNLERKRGGTLWHSVLWTLMSVILAMTALMITLPLWWIPPLAILLPALIWGWLPSLVWASGALFAAAFVILIPVAVWIYTLVFIFSALWFVHFLLLALSNLREEPVTILNEAPL